MKEGLKRMVPTIVERVGDTICNAGKKANAKLSVYKIDQFHCFWRFRGFPYGKIGFLRYSEI
jgi:hypothetical protein